MFASAIVAQASNLFNLPLTFSLDESSTDITQWRTFNFVYCHQVQSMQAPTHWKQYASILRHLPHNLPRLSSQAMIYQPAVQGPFASAAKLLAAFQSGQLDICSLPAPYSGSPPAINWASTVPLKAPEAGVNRTDAPPAVINGGLQSQVHLRQRRVCCHTPCSRSLSFVAS